MSGLGLPGTCDAASMGEAAHALQATTLEVRRAGYPTRATANRAMSAEATGHVWRLSPFTGSQLLVHLAIADVVNDLHDNEFWMSTETLAQKARVSRSTVVETLRLCVQAGLLEVLEAGGARRQPTRYRFLFTSAPSGVTSAISDATRPDSARNTKEPNEIRNSASAVSGLAPSGDPNCPRCLGRGSYFGGAGFDVPCPCVDERPTVKVEERTG